MRFSFNVKLNDDDYYLFNEFTLKHSSMSKKTETAARILVTLIFLLGTVNIFISNGINTSTVITAAILVALWVVFFRCFEKFNNKVIKSQLKTLLKKGKKPYTPDSVLEFYDDFFKEISPDNKSEIRYTAIDKISVVKNRYIFLFLDGIRGYVVPYGCFENEEQEKEFIGFLGTVCNKTEFFDKI